MVEAKAVTEFLGCRLIPIKTDRGKITGADMEIAFHDAPGAIGLVEVENTHNWESGAVYPMVFLAMVWVEAVSRGVPVHMDGARLGNALARALGKRVRDMPLTRERIMATLLAE